MTKLLAALVLGLASLSIAAEPLNTKCPITRDAANPAITSTYQKTIEFCCDKCKAKFDATPKAYLTSIIKARKGQCPLSNKASTPGKTSVYSRNVAFKDAAAKAKFDASPDMYITEVKQ